MATFPSPQIPVKPLARSRQQLVWQRFKRDPMALLAIFFLLAALLAILLRPWIYPLSPTHINFTQALLPPSQAHPLGTNDLGQDQLARLLAGGLISLAVGITAMAIAMTLGVVVGSIAGFYGGWVDGVLMRITDLFLALPQLPLVLLIIYLFNEPIRNRVGPVMGMFLLITGVIGGFTWMSVARLVRGGFLSLKSRNFVQAALSLGANPRQVIGWHLLPNVIGPVTVSATIAVGNAILAESTLSFLGLGFPPDVPTWGRMLFDAQNYMESAPHLVIFPGLAIFLTVLSVNAMGDALRDALDPSSPRG